MAIQELNSWGEDEQFYRGYYYAQKKGKQEIYLQLADEQEEWIEFVTDPENIHAHETEDMFFKKRGISVLSNIQGIFHSFIIPMAFLKLCMYYRETVFRV